MLPFLPLGGGELPRLDLGQAQAHDGSGRSEGRGRCAGAAAAAAQAAAEEPITAALKIDDLKIELGYALLPLVNAPDGTDRQRADQGAAPLAGDRDGVCRASVRILDNVQLEANTYIIKIKEVDGTGPDLAGQLHGHGPDGRNGDRAGHPHHRADVWPAGDLDRCRAEGRGLLKGYTVVDAATVLSTHLTELLKNNVADLLSYGEGKSCSRSCRRNRANWSRTSCRRRSPSPASNVLQLLLAERISIRDLSTILEGIADAVAFSRNPATIVELRARLARQICAQHTSMNGYLPLIALSAKWEQAFAESIIGTGEEQTGDATQCPGIYHPGARAFRAGGARR